MGSPSPPQQKAVSCISAASPNHVTPESVPPSDSAMIKQRPCSLCHEVEIPNTLTRCKDCNKGYQRILLYKKQLEGASLDAWDNMSKEKKSAFIKENHMLTGDNLKAKIQAVCNEELQRKVTITLRGNGEFLDSPDLAEKYKHKPEQLINVRARANSFICPARGTRIYEDMEYQTTFKEENTHMRKRKLELSKEDNVRANIPKPPPKTPKATALAYHPDSRMVHTIETCPAHPPPNNPTSRTIRIDPICRLHQNFPSAPTMRLVNEFGGTSFLCLR